MADSERAEVRVSQRAEGRHVDITLTHGQVERLLSGGTVNLDFFNSEVAFEDSWQSDDVTAGEEQAGLRDITIDVHRD